MKLRLRLALTTVVATVPVVVMLIWLDARMRHAATREDLADVTRSYMLAGDERARCEAHAGSWGGVPIHPPGAPPAATPLSPGTPPPLGGSPPPGPPPRGRPQVAASRPGEQPPILFAYDAELRSHNPVAPRITGSPRIDAWPGSRVVVLVPMPWRTGPCAYILAHGTTNPRWIGALLPGVRVWLLPVASTLGAILISGGFVVRRMRRLARAVQASAGARFTAGVPVEGNDEITELARAFDAATTEVRRLLDEKDARERQLREFLANTTHDVMIPLSVLKARLSTIAEQGAAGGPIDPSAVSGAWNEAHYLGALIHNLAIAVKLDAGVPDLAGVAVDLVALVERVILRHRPIAEQLGIELAHGVPDERVEVDGDETLLEQTLNNVVYNAIRYNRPGGHVGVTLDLVPGGFRFRIVDDGPGVPDDELGRLGKRGYRHDEARRRNGAGQGLGLNIASRVAAVHGFSLSFARAEEGGLQVDLSGPWRATSTSSRRWASIEG